MIKAVLFMVIFFYKDSDSFENDTFLHIQSPLVLRGAVEMTLLRGRILEALLLTGLLLVEEVEGAGLLLPTGFPVGLLTGFPADLPVVGLSPPGAAAAGFSSAATGWEGLS